MTNDDRREVMQAIERLEAFQNAQPSRRFLVAIDAALSQLERFRKRVCEAIAAGSTDPELTHWTKECEALIGHLQHERLRVSKLVQQGMN